MSKFTSSDLIAGLQAQTETILNNAIAQWQMLPTNVLLCKPDETKWSAIQCLMHLNSYGNYYLPAIQKTIETAGNHGWLAPETFTSSFIGDWFTGLMQPQGEKQVIKKMKSPKEHVPTTNENSDAVLAEFIDQQERLIALLERAKSIDLRKAKTPVSISRFIRLPLGDTFRFLIAHNERHLLQAERSIIIAKEKTAAV